LPPESLPQVVHDEVQRMQRERREELQSFIDIVDGHFRPVCPPANINGSHTELTNSHLQQQQQQQQKQKQQQLVSVSCNGPDSVLPALAPTAPALTSGVFLDPLASQLSSINVSNNADVLAQLSIKLQACGVTSLSDLEGMGIDDVRASVAGANLNPLQFKRVLDAVSKPKP
jgi:hypothetical protein